MRKPEQGVACPGCPHRAAFVVVKDAVGRGRGRVFCGNGGCPVVGQMHPAALTCPGGDAALLPRYRQQVPSGDEQVPARVCAHFVTDRELMAGAEGLSAEQARVVAAQAPDLGHLSAEGECVLLCVLASSRAWAAGEGLNRLADRARELGCGDARILDPFDTAASGAAVFSALEQPGVHALIFASPCVQLMSETFEPAEINEIACVGCMRCTQITGCPALSFVPPVCVIDTEACAGCDLCADYCRTHTILSPRQRMTPAEKRFARYSAARFDEEQGED
ncbi:hypothetical protein [Collinsella sp. An7]|uniref:hypothetical protein n=1 Tax=Collinsella sp. An7 TaxID=1965651 RepID=UPI000B3AA136|nr:hypothetical protein [Collinsella sp. An7]